MIGDLFPHVTGNFQLADLSKKKSKKGDGSHYQMEQNSYHKTPKTNN